MVLVVETNIVGESVERAIVRVRLRERDVGCRAGLVLRLWWRRRPFEHVVLCDEVSRTRVQAAGKKAAHYEIAQGVPAAHSHQRVVECELGCYIEGMRPRERQLVNKHGAKGIEQDLEGAEESLSKDRVEKERLEGGGKVCIQSINTERLVMR